MTNLSPDLTDEEFIHAAYAALLDRGADPSGLQTNLSALAQGASRLDVVASLARSSEFYGKQTAAMLGTVQLPNLQEIRPQQYERVRVLHSADEVLVFRADQAADYDWLEQMILEHGYYEKPGVWSFAVDEDKQVLARILKGFEPRHCLEIGCANGSVLKLLHEAGVAAEGVEISHLAVALAFPSIRRSIHFGDLLSLALPKHYDVLAGMDIFEHLNPNKLSAYLDRCYELLTDGGLVYTNIPAFGHDVVFAEPVFPLYLQPWFAARDAAPFSHLHVDGAGWPINGHLIWATAAWWQARFEEAGFSREQELERALHARHDEFYINAAPARRSFFVFSKNASRDRIAHLTSKI